MHLTYNASGSVVRAVDDHLLELRQAQARPTYRQRLLSDVPAVPAIGTLRVLRSLQRAETAGRTPSIRDVAEDLEIEHSTASRAVNQTTELGLTDRRSSDDDRRRVVLTLTEAGRSAADTATGNRRQMVAAAMSAWTPSDVATFETLLGRYVSGLAAATSETDLEMIVGG